jgi:hypothetical protein
MKALDKVAPSFFINLAVREAKHPTTDLLCSASLLLIPPENTPNYQHPFFGPYSLSN